MRVVLIHGYNSGPDQNFHPWLAAQLKDKGFEVIAPKLPLEGEPEALVCIDALVKAVGRLDEKTIILGHSLGAVLALRYLEAAEAVSTPRAVILVGAPWQTKSEKVKAIFLSEFDYDVVAWKAKEFVIVHDKEDKLVPFDHAEKYQKMLNAELVETTGCDHFMESEYPILLQTILKKFEPLPPIEPGHSLSNRYADIP
ncbi:MAG: alpha/beta fold hydrolase [Patescibacteria group bacterium]